jgi:hypothetical protein
LDERSMKLGKDVVSRRHRRVAQDCKGVKSNYCLGTT